MNVEQLTFLFGVIVLIANIIGSLIGRSAAVALEKRLSKLETKMMFVSARLGFTRKDIEEDD